MTLYGVIAGISHPKEVELALRHFSGRTENVSVDNIIVNGDLFVPTNDNERAITAKEVEDHHDKVFELLAESGKRIFVQPGLHDTIFFYEPALQRARSKYNTKEELTIIDARLNQVIRMNDDFGHHDLLFIPGSPNDKSQYVHGSLQGESTLQLHQDHIGWQEVTPTQAGESRTPTKLRLFYSMHDYNKSIISSELTTIISPHSRDFSQLSLRSIDVTPYFEGDINNAQLPKDLIDKIGVRRYYTEVKKALEEYGYKLEHTGSAELRNYMQDNKVTKSIASSRSINAHIAHSSKGAASSRAKPSNDIHYNTGRLENGQAGLISLVGKGMAYHNIDIYSELTEFKVLTKYNSN